MKVHSHLLALCSFHANFYGTTAFSVKAAFSVRNAVRAPSAVVLRSSTASAELATFLTGGNENVNKSLLVGPSDLMYTPTFPQMESLQGGQTVQTYKMPPWAEVCQVRFETAGRPLKANVELMLGPIRTTHKLELDIEDGNLTPYQATLKFKKASQVVRVTTSKNLELPVQVGVFVPSPQRSKELVENTVKVWETCTKEQKQVIQGGSTEGGGGAYRWWTIPENVESVQLLAWSRDTGKKSLRVGIEVLQGPNTVKQRISLQCGGGSQPYHAVLQMPGSGSTIGIQNKKFLEDGLVQIAILPYEMSKDVYE